MGFSKKTREEVYRKYDGHCAYCGRKIEIRDMQIDHFIPKHYDYYYKHEYDGDIDDFKNLMPSCRICNHYKRANSIEWFRKCIETIPCKLAERMYIYKVGMAYGFYDGEPWEVKFYFEKCEENKNDTEGNSTI